jgi:hypothetical protein
VNQKSTSPTVQSYLPHAHTGIENSPIFFSLIAAATLAAILSDDIASTVFQNDVSKHPV